MSSVSYHDELMLAASAAGYAMAGTDDMFETAAIRAMVVTSAVYEDAARGAREPKAMVPAVLPMASDLKGRLANGAHAVRDSVYGYLRLGMPA